MLSSLVLVPVACCFESEVRSSVHFLRRHVGQHTPGHALVLVSKPGHDLGRGRDQALHSSHFMFLGLITLIDLFLV